MSQRLLEANQRKVAGAADPVERARLLQDRAILLARLGRVEEAERTLVEAESDAASMAHAGIKPRFAYARAIVTYFSKRFRDAQQQMREVLEQARTEQQRVLVAECESALALFMQREGDVRAAARHARAVLASPDATLEARYRASLALASLHQDSRDYEAAYRLYRETRDVVQALDDEIAMASWLQRAALSQAAHARQAAAQGELDAHTLNEAVEALQAGIAYAAQVQNGPDTSLDHLLLAEMRVLQKRYKEALALYDKYLPHAEGDGFLHEVTSARADRANCLLQLGEIDAGYAEAVGALRRLDESAPADIRAIVHENMASALERLDHRLEAEQHRMMSKIAWETYGHEQREARRLLHENVSDTLH
jgi:tetratricopeptide (TPR) repeat protein